ncbi:MAG: STT3 domain-containing protein [Patescibacteria group bacterium]|jgi:4-amino-4-deoxy-L-arabinose transferase-like glycosyltransferase
MFLKKYLNLIIVSLLALVFFTATASFNYLSQDSDYVKWSSPDETANYFFTKNFALTGELAVFDKANLVSDNMAIPRSVRSDSGFMKPVSFLGITLIYGTIAAATDIAVIPYLTPLFAALGIILFYLIIRRLFSERVGLWSAFLLASFPVYSYYTVRSMFHNILFVVLLLAGLYLFLLALGEKSEKIKAVFLTWRLSGRVWLESSAALASGLFMGLALITRTSEALWLLPSLLVIWIFYARRYGIMKAILSIVGLSLPLLLVAYYNQILYGSFWYGGYNEMNRSLKDIAKTGGEIFKFGWGWDNMIYYRDYLLKIFKNIFYFGFNPGQSKSIFINYVIKMFPALFYAGLAGILLLIVQNCRRFQKKYLVYVLVWLGLSAFLVVYYGSWRFNDNPDLARYTIGNSYTRYWLPFYLGLMPLAALALVRVSRALLLMSAKTTGRIRRIIATGLQSVAILVFAAVSIIFVLYGSEEGLAYLYYNNQAEKLNTLQVWALTDKEGIIITRYYDKFFWPERRIIMGVLPDDGILKAAVKLVRYYPVYYYNFYLKPVDVEYLNQNKFAPYGLIMEEVKKVNAKFGLYKLEVGTSTVLIK